MSTKLTRSTVSAMRKRRSFIEVGSCSSVLTLIPVLCAVSPSLRLILDGAISRLPALNCPVYPSLGLAGYKWHISSLLITG